LVSIGWRHGVEALNVFVAERFRRLDNIR